MKNLMIFLGVMIVTSALDEYFRAKIRTKMGSSVEEVPNRTDVCFGGCCGGGGCS